MWGEQGQTFGEREPWLLLDMFGHTSKTGLAKSIRSHILPTSKDTSLPV